MNVAVCHHACVVLYTCGCKDILQGTNVRPPATCPAHEDQLISFIEYLVEVVGE